MYTDSHAHLEGKRYDADRAEVFARATSSRRHHHSCYRQWRWSRNRHARLRHQARAAVRLDLRDRRNPSARGRARQADPTSTNCSGSHDRPKSLPGARLDSTISTTIRRATCSSASSFSRWRWRARPSCRSSFTAARRTTARMPGTTCCASSASTGPPAASEACCTASPARSSTPAPRSILASCFLRRQHHLSQGAEHSRRGRHRAARPHVHRDRFSLSRACAPSRPAQRARIRCRGRAPDRRTARSCRRKKSAGKLRKISRNFFRPDEIRLRCCDLPPIRAAIPCVADCSKRALSCYT